MPTATAAALTCNRLGLLEALIAIGPAIPSRSPRPVLMNVKLTAGPDGCELLATDLEVGIRHRVLGVQSDDLVSLLLSPGRLSSILKTSDDETIYIAVDESHVVVRGRRSEFRLPSESADLFPDVPAFEASNYHELKGEDLRRLIVRTSYAADNEGSARYALGGCLAESVDDTLAFVATDGRRLAKQVVPAARIGDGITPGQYPVLPLKALRLIARVIEDDETVSIAITDKAVMVQTATATIYSRLVEGRFPAYASVFPSDPATKIHFPEIADLRSAFEQASIVTSEESRGTDVRVGNGTLQLSSQAADVGSSQIDLPTTYEGDEMLTCFDPRYCLDLLKAMDGAESLTMELISPKDPAVFRNETGMSACIMPLTRDR